MQKPRHKKRQTKKPVPVPNALFHMQGAWILAVLAVSIACLMLVIFAASRGQLSTDAAALPTPVTGLSAAMPIGADTPATSQTTGVFPLSKGGPIPVPANVLHPSNIARVVVNNVLMSIYAGSMARTPAIGVLAILQENLTTGQQSLHLYQTSQPVGALTILAIHNDVLTLSTAKANGTFNLATHQFHF